MSKGIYQIWIGISHAGFPLVGAAEGANKAPVRTQVYPSQMGHRCVARSGKELVIVTPTEARTQGMQILCYFPRAERSMARR